MVAVLEIEATLAPGRAGELDWDRSRPSPMLSNAHALAAPPEGLAFGRVKLRFDKVVPGDAAKGLVPYYHFRILLPDNTEVGHINFRVGNTDHIRGSAGHIGYQVLQEYRGNGYALDACRALAPFVRTIYPAVNITCNPDNHASRRTIENLGARFVDEIAVPEDDPQYASGARRKRRYEWRPSVDT